MPSSTFDENRFVDEVLKPIKDGWQPSENLFRVYLLVDTVNDEAVIRTALEDVSRAVTEQRLQHTWAAPITRVRAGHGEASAVLLDRGRRREHAAAVRARSELLQAAVAERLAGGPGLPVRVVAGIAAESRGRHTRTEIRLALAELGAAERDPVDLPPVAPPQQWAKVRELLGNLNRPSLWEYLERDLRSGATADETLLDARKREVSKRRDESTTAESSLIEIARGLIRNKALPSALRFELYDDLKMQVRLRYPYQVLRDQASALAGRIKALKLGLSPDDLAYALWCQVRFEDSGGSAWRIEYREARQAKDLRRAIQVLSGAGKLPADEEKQLKQLTLRIQELDAQLKTAAQLESRDPESAAELYLSIGRELSDPALETGLKRCLPPAPESVAAVLQGPRVTVSWTSSRARVGSIGYTVVRAVGHAPAGPNDGLVVTANTSQTAAADPNPPAAQQLHYAVFTVRDGATLSRGASAAPIVALPEVSGLVLIPAPDAISGRWESPNGANGVEVTRRPADSTQSMVKLPGVRSTGFTDTDVRPDERYEYRIHVRYQLPDGSLSRTSGLFIVGECQEVPIAVTTLDARLEDSEVVVSWEAPKRGDVEIYDVGRGASPQPQVMPHSALARIGQPVAGTYLRTRTGLRSRPSATAGVLTLVAVTVLGELAAVGPSRVLDLRQRPVTDLRAVRYGDDVRLTWVWPDGANEARVLYRRDAFPDGPEDSKADRLDISRVGYETSGVRIRIDSGTNHFSVCTVSPGTASDPGRRYGQLVTVSERATGTVSYRIDRAGLLARQKRVLNVGDPAGTPLPPMVLVAKGRTRPIFPGDGTEIRRMEGGAVVVNELFEVPAELRRPVHLRLFSLDPAVVLVAERPDQLIVS